MTRTFHLPAANAAQFCQTLLDATTNSAFLIDADGFFLAANEIGANRLGMEAQSIVGVNARTLVPWDVFERRMLKVNDVYCEQKPVRFEDERQGIYFDNLFSPVFDQQGKVACVAMFAQVITDVKQAQASLGQALAETERRVLERTRDLEEANKALKQEIRQRKRAETALRESETRFRQLAENLEDVFWLMDVGPPLQTLYVSPAFENIWGFPAEKLYADPDAWIKSVHENDFRGLIMAFESFLRGETEFRAEFRIIRPDGAVRWILDRGTRVLDKRGRISRLVGVAQDITDRKRAQRHQEDLVEELRQFSYIVSHDLRAPLINIKGFSGEIRLALEDISPGLVLCKDILTTKERVRLDLALEEDLPEALGFIESSVSRMEGMINAILKLSRIGRRQTTVKPLDMGRVAAEVIASLAFQIQDVRAKVQVGDLPTVPADPMDMAQVFANLIGNALQYLDPKRPGRIDIQGRLFFDEARFEVRDNGVGVPADQVDRIFDLFYRIQETNSPGEGMGLACIRTVIRRHGGRIWCESTHGAGSTFYFTIPLSKNLEKGPRNGKS